MSGEEILAQIPPEILQMLPPEIVEGIGTGQIPPEMVAQILQELLGSVQTQMPDMGPMPPGPPPGPPPGMGGMPPMV